MSWRGTLLLLIFAGIALGFFFFSGLSRTHSPQELLLGIDPTLAEKIQIQEGGALFSLIKTQGIWMIQKNLENGASLPERANPQLIHSLLEAAADITPLDILQSSDLKGAVTLSSLGLKKPNRSITIYDGKKQTLWIGTEGAAPGSLYTRLDSGKNIYLISGKIASVAFRPPQEYRDPRLTALATDHLVEVSIVKSGAMQQLNLKKNPEGLNGSTNGWVLTSPVSAKGDEQAVTSWIDSLLGAQIVRWMPEGTDLASCGLDTPSSVITLHDAGGTTPLTISIGSPVSDSPGSYFVRCSDRPGICVVGGNITHALAVTPQSLRSRKMQPVEYDTVDRVEINGYYLKRKTGSDNWIGRSEEGASGQLVTGERVRQLYDQLQGLSAISFEPATPEHLALRGLANMQERGFSATNQPLTIRLIATLSENTAQENAGQTVLAEYRFGVESNGEVALREGLGTEIMILPAREVEFLNTFRTRPAKP